MKKIASLFIVLFLFNVASAQAKNHNIEITSARSAIQGPRPSSLVVGHPNVWAAYWQSEKYDGYCGPSSISMFIAGLAHQKLSRVAIAKWAYSSNQLTPLSGYSGVPLWNGPALAYGMTPNNMVATLNYYGQRFDFQVDTSSSTFANVLTLLSHGQEVIAMIRAETIWHEGIGTTPDHFLIITGYDPTTNMVFVNDPGTNVGREEDVPVGIFKDAWATSTNLIINQV